MNWRVLLWAGVAWTLAACASAPTVDRILEDGDCATVPDIERLAITVSDRGSKVSFRWTRSRFAGTVLAGTAAVEKDASYGVNRIGEWERRFPQVSAATTVPGAYLGFPAASDARAGVLAATVYDEQYPPLGSPGNAVVVVDLKTRDTQLVGAKRQVGGLAWSPKGDYFALLEIAPTARMGGWRDLFLLASPQPSVQSDVHLTIYAPSGLAACSRLVASGLPAPSPSAAWE